MSPVPAMYDRVFSPSRADLNVDVATLDQLRKSVGSDDQMQRPGRLQFHVAILCTGGEGWHEVDFTPITMQPGRVVHVMPGQVHKWCLDQPYEATIVFCSDTEWPERHFDRWPIGPRWFDLGDAELRRSLQIIEFMLGEYEIDRTSQSRNRALAGALRLLFVNLGLDQLASGNRPDMPQPYLDLMDQLGNTLGWSRSVTDHADELGYSTRTLTRACQNAVGLTAKQVVDDRIMLEARRLLVHADTTVETVARQLSFSESSNFAKFFRRNAGENPDTWRTHQLSRSRQGTS